MTDGFALDPRLGSGSAPVADWPLCHVRLKDDARFPWLLLVPRRPAIVELTDLAPGDQAALWGEIVRASRLVQEVARPEKLNVAALGNVVAQLHVHVIGRFANDPAWPDPVWCHGAGPGHGPSELERLAGRYATAAGHPAADPR
jgi:diadenosine tetraphosphate (Ap4A) HIT family hydrolase